MAETAKAASGQVAAAGPALTLEGEIESFTMEAAAFSSRDTAGYYRIVLSVKAQLVDGKNGRIVWKGGETVRNEYPATADLALQQNARNAAIQAACREMARQILAHINQAF